MSAGPDDLSEVRLKTTKPFEVADVCQMDSRSFEMLAYIDAGTAAAIAAMATGGLAGAKVAAESFIFGRRGKKKAKQQAETAEMDNEFYSEEFDADDADVDALPAS